MIELLTQPNDNPNVSKVEVHILALPSGLCPRSKNPQPQSTIKIVYRPKSFVLEIGRLYAYLDQYKGGLRDEAGNIVVRSMEGMIDRVALDCAAALGTPVRVYADLVLAPREVMRLKARAYPMEVQA
jgi:NADPH-dependent 7-cyano-7-deazaguanine reductase QueF